MIDRLVLSLARLLVAPLFLLAGLGKLGDPAGFAAGLAGFGMPLPALVAWALIALEIGGAIILVIGWQARAAALALAVFTVAASFVAHAFWTMPAEQVDAQRSQFLKNLAVAGGLLALMLAGERGTLRDLATRRSR
jgi:putative oxidoreductase